MNREILERAQRVAKSLLNDSGGFERCPVRTINNPCKSRTFVAHRSAVSRIARGRKDAACEPDSATTCWPKGVNQRGRACARRSSCPWSRWKGWVG